MSTTKVLVLGASGMLGSMVYGYLKRNSSLDVVGTVRNEKLQNNNLTLFDAEEFNLSATPPKDFESFDYVINCIGIIKPYCQDNDSQGVKRAIKVNAMFPHNLSLAGNKHNVKIIQIATDCVYSGKAGKYCETDPSDALDVYGKTKSLGEVIDGNLLNIRCSIIGPEKQNHLSLLDWFLSNKSGSALKGFSHHNWNGVTTLQYAKLCETIITNPSNLFDNLIKTSHMHHFLPNSTVNKFELLNIFKNVFNKNYTIVEVDNIGQPVDRTLSTKHNLIGELYPEQTMESAIEELRDYIESKLY